MFDIVKFKDISCRLFVYKENERSPRWSVVWHDIVFGGAFLSLFTRSWEMHFFSSPRETIAFRNDQVTLIFCEMGLLPQMQSQPQNLILEQTEVEVD